MTEKDYDDMTILEKLNYINRQFSRIAGEQRAIGNTPVSDEITNWSGLLKEEIHELKFLLKENSSDDRGG